MQRLARAMAVVAMFLAGTACGSGGDDGGDGVQPCLSNGLCEGDRVCLHDYCVEPSDLPPEGSFLWGRVWAVGEPGFDQYGRSGYDRVGLAADGGFLRASTFGGALTLGDADSSTTLDEPTGGYYLARFSPDGALEWAGEVGGPVPEGSPAWTSWPDPVLCAAPDGSAKIFATALDPVVFGGGEPAGVETAGLLAAQFDPSGSLEWARAVGTNAGVLTTTPQREQACVAHGFSWSLDAEQNSVIDPGGTSETALPDNSNFEALVDASGAIAWVEVTAEEEKEIDIRQASNVVVSEDTMPDGGHVWSALFLLVITLRPVDSGEVQVDAQGRFDLLIVRTTAAHEIEWYRHIPSSGNTGFHTLHTVASPDGSFTVFTSFSGEVDFGAGGAVSHVLSANAAAEPVVVRYTPEGDVAWSSRTSGGELTSATSLPDGSAVVTGYYSAGMSEVGPTFGVGEPWETTLPNSTQYASESFVVRYDGSGEVLWARRLIGKTGDQEDGTGTRASAITARPDGVLLVSGKFWDLAVLGPGAADEVRLENVGKTYFQAAISP